MVPGRLPEVASVEVIREEEIQRGWRYTLAVRREGAPETRHEVTLSWADHEFWCGGRLPPSRVVETVVGYFVARAADREVPPRFDAATVRRWFPEVDAQFALGDSA